MVPHQLPINLLQFPLTSCDREATSGFAGPRSRLGKDCCGSLASSPPDTDFPCLPIVPPVLPGCSCAKATVGISTTAQAKAATRRIVSSPSLRIPGRTYVATRANRSEARTAPIAGSSPQTVRKCAVVLAHERWGLVQHTPVLGGAKDGFGSSTAPRPLAPTTRLRQQCSGSGPKLALPRQGDHVPQGDISNLRAHHATTDLTLEFFSSEAIDISQAPVGPERTKKINVQIRHEYCSLLETNLQDQAISNVVVCGGVNVRVKAPR
jgi:hypothetical protein